MDIQDRAEQIVRKAIAASGKYRLRLPPPEQAEKAKSDCIVEIAALIAQQGLTLEQAFVHAARATYRAVEAEGDRDRTREAMARMLDALDLAEAASTGTPDQARAALASLAKQRTLISSAVEIGQAIHAKQRASAAGKARQKSSALLKAFAIEEYERGSWKSIRQARDALWPIVQAKAQEIGCPITATHGPETVYGWLLARNKSTRSAG